MRCKECGSNMRIGAPAPSFFMRGYDTTGIIHWQCTVCEWYQWYSGTSPNVLLGREAGTINFDMDGNQWCATRIGFTNLQEWEAGFGSTKREAALALVAAEEADIAKESAP